ncbi:hypothetical protein LOK49_LG01G04107 [Camellia lanceoleosa]|uniref:Uncharacterized protein n=1 Tax=Camellia lanceoleosa TaxID=1840588 RepID=A0ACC0IX20_9ERIC|nr:hypothetical protein LOK49_LG01G04107 [Camellia lanceoleosa]
MWHSKNQLGKLVDIDRVMHEIEKMMIFGSSEGGWALLSKGGASAAEEMITERGSFIQDCFSNYGKWKDDVKPSGFMEALRIFIKKTPPLPHPYVTAADYCFQAPALLLIGFRTK